MTSCWNIGEPSPPPANGSKGFCQMCDTQTPRRETAITKVQPNNPVAAKVASLSTGKSPVMADEARSTDMTSWPSGGFGGVCAQCGGNSAMAARKTNQVCKF